MLLADLVAASETVAATRARSKKVAALAEVIGRLSPGEVETGVAFLSGQTRQGRIGIGWATVRAVDPPPAPSPSLTIGDVDDVLDLLAVTSGSGSAAARVTRLTALLARATQTEASFLKRLLLGDLRQGALEGIVADAVAKAFGVPLAAVRRATMLSGDLRVVAVLAQSGGEAALAAVGLEVLRPVQPMLAATAADVHEAIAACGLSSVEWKLDGARVQVHRAGREVRIFTRNLNDVTERLPGVVAVVRALPADSLILDGEAIGLAEDQRPELFQDTMSRFGSQDGGGGTLGALFFDCLHLDGEDLIDRPLSDRIAALDQLASSLRVPAVVTDDPETAAAFAHDAVASGHEGVMVKGATSIYEAGRRGSAWRKVKPVITLDLVVLAAEWGYGRRQGWLSNLHLGARDPDGGFVMVGKTFKGLTDALLTWQTATFPTIETSTDGHVVFVRPELVVEIAIDGVQASTRYPGGVALRFARVRRYRPDKSPAEADTIDAVRALLRHS